MARELVVFTQEWRGHLHRIYFVWIVMDSALNRSLAATPFPIFFVVHLSPDSGVKETPDTQKTLLAF